MTSEKVDFKTRTNIGDDFTMIKTKSDNYNETQCVIIVGGFNDSFSIPDRIRIWYNK